MALEITRGDDYLAGRRLVVTVVDEDGATVNLTGTTARFMVKQRRADADAQALISKTTGGGGITLADQSGADKGKAYIAITAADTEDGPAGMFAYELEATDSIGVITLATGQFRILADLVRA